MLISPPLRSFTIRLLLLFAVANADGSAAGLCCARLCLLLLLALCIIIAGAVVVVDAVDTAVSGLCLHWGDNLAVDGFPAAEIDDENLRCGSCIGCVGIDCSYGLFADRCEFDVAGILAG